MRFSLLSFCFCLFIVLLQKGVIGQPNTMQYLFDLPQSTDINPSFHNNNSKFWIGVPGISGIQGELNTGGVTWNDAIMNDPTNFDSLLVDIDGFVDALSNKPFLYEELSISLLSFGFKAKNNNFFFAVNERQMARGYANKTLFEFLRDGNAPYQGQTLDFDNPWGEAVHFREYALGASREISKKLTIGGTLKFLYGKSVVKGSCSDLKLYTSDISEGNKIQLTSNSSIKYSAPARVILNNDGMVRAIEEDFSSISDYLMNTNNQGFSVSAGVTYKAKPNITLSASIMDLGFISWQDSAQQFEQKGIYNFEGLDLKPIVDDGKFVQDEIEDAYVNLADSVRRNFRFIENADQFKTILPTKIYLGVRFYSSENMYWGILSRTRFFHGKLDEKLTFSGNMKVNDYLSISGSWSLTKGKYNNLGLGILGNIGNIQIYAVSDNMPALIYPTTNSYADFRFGMNYIFREKQEKIKAWAPPTCKSLSRTPSQRKKSYRKHKIKHL